MEKERAGDQEKGQEKGQAKAKAKGTGKEKETKKRKKAAAARTTQKQSPAPRDDAGARETGEPRSRKACMRCRVQKLRTECVGGGPDGEGECWACQQFSKTSHKTIHRVACFRGKLTEAVLFRQGGLNLTSRWSGTAMRDVGDRKQPAAVRTIHVTLGLCERPMVLDVVGFATRPGDVTARYWHVREGERGDEVRKKDLDAYCLDNIWSTAAYFERYVVDNAVPAFLKQSTAAARLHGLPPIAQEVVRRTYAVAVEHYLGLEDEIQGPSGKMVNPEKQLLGNLFVLWFATRHTTGSAYICGDDKLGMKPETKDETYPLFGKVSLPRMIVAQFDSLNHTRVLVKYGRKVLQDLEAFIFRNQPRWWWTIYLCVFILLREASFISADRYRHARNNHGARFRYTIPGFVEELQEGCNNILMHWHYYNCKPWPSPGEPWTRYSHFLSGLSPEHYDLVMETLADPRTQRQLSFWTRYKEENGYVERFEMPIREGHETPYMGSQVQFDWDHPFYWISQVFEDKWEPHPTYQREYLV